MKYSLTLSRQTSVYAIVTLLLFQIGCSSPKIAAIQASDDAVTQTDVMASSKASANEHTATMNNDEPAAASTQTRIISSPASAYETARQMQAEQTKTANTVQAAKKVKSPIVKMALKAAVKKVEKAHKKFDIKKDKKANALDPDIRTGILIGVLGLALIIIGTIIGQGGLLITLGSIGVTVGLVIIILAALDVI